jgi:RNA polymerase sigma factor (sigma-70 family)
MASLQLGAALREIQRLFGDGAVAGLTDAQLVERFATSRDQAAFEALVERHGPMVLSVCRNLLKDPAETEDAFQATFVILVRKAGAIRVDGSLAGWLYRVAYRVALQANADASRRSAVEREATDMAGQAAARRRAGDDTVSVLHEELARLPEKYRAPIILCHLEEMTHAEAAHQLRWTVGMVRGRVAKARELLRTRLTRRGVEPSSAFLAGALFDHPVTAVPVAWADAAIATAMTLTSPDKAAAAGVISFTTLSLSEKVLKTMVVANFKILAGFLAATGTAAALALAIGAELGRAAPAGKGASGRMTSPDRSPRAAGAGGARGVASSDNAKDLVFEGQVLDPDGRPLAGAKLYLMLASSGPSSSAARTARALSDAAGRFRFRVPDAEIGNLDPRLRAEGVLVLATAPGFGPGFVPLPIQSEKDVRLKLVRDDVPIRGRLIDIQGRAVAGAIVRPTAIKIPFSGDLAETIKELPDGEQAPLVESKRLRHWSGAVTAFIPEVTTDKDGRFAIAGTGRERMLEVVVAGPSMALSRFNIMTRKTATVTAPVHRGFPDLGRETYHGADFDHVTLANATIEGTVRDRATRRPLKGVTVRGHRDLGGAPLTMIASTTDDQGHFRLNGFARGQQANLLAVPDQKLPYLPSQLMVDAKQAPARVDFDLMRGVWVTGRLTEKLTGKPARGHVQYFAFQDNPHLKEAPGFAQSFDASPSVVDENGEFRMVVLPGKGLLAAQGWIEGRSFLRGVGADKVDGPREGEQFSTVPFYVFPGNYHVVAPVDPQPGAESAECNLVLESGTSMRVRVVGPDGMPLAGTTAFGVNDGGDRVDVATSEFTVNGIAPRAGRLVVVRHDAKRLIGTAVVHGGSSGGMVIAKLQPWGAFTGRLVNANGEPVDAIGLELIPYTGPNQAPGGPLPDGRIRIEKDGRFRVPAVVPGVKYYLALLKNGVELTGYAVNGAMAEPGQTKDLGDLKTTPLE